MPNGDFEHLSEREILIQIYERIKVLPDHAERIDDLESITDKQAGFIKAASIIGGALWAVLTTWLGIHTMGNK